MRAALESVRLLVSSPGTISERNWRVSLNRKFRQRKSLRYEVFNLELNEGLASSHATGNWMQTPSTPFAIILLVEHVPTGHIVGTYRLQTGLNAKARLGYYCAQEFEFGVYEPLRAQIIELGRACVHRQHRNLVVLGMLWKGIADYAKANGARFLMGCRSITSQDPAVGASTYAELSRKHLVQPGWRTVHMA